MTDKKLLSEHEVDLFNKWWHAANYLSIGQIYLMNNPLFPHYNVIGSDE